MGWVGCAGRRPGRRQTRPSPTIGKVSSIEEVCQAGSSACEACIVVDCHLALLEVVADVRVEVVLVCSSNQAAARAATVSSTAANSIVLSCGVGTVRKYTCRHADISLPPCSHTLKGNELRAS